MLYRVAAAVTLGLVAPATAFSPATTSLAPPAQPLAATRPAIAALRMAGGTETLDFTAGDIRKNRDVTDEQMRPRPSIDWSNLRAKLELEFKFSDEELKKFDSVTNEDLTSAYAASCRHPCAESLLLFAVFCWNCANES